MGTGTIYSYYAIPKIIVPVPILHFTKLDNMRMNAKIKKPVTGLHIIGQIRTDADNDNKLKSEESFKLSLSRFIRKYRIQELGSYYFKFGDDAGFTGVVCLVESHVAIHTWPELQYLTLDVFLCNYSKNNEEVCRKLFSDICAYFNPLSVDKKEIIR